MAKPWIKFWHDLLADTTIQRWPPAQRYCWAGLLLIVSQAKVEGQLTDSGGEALTVSDLSSQLNVDWHTADRFLDRAQAAGKIARDADGVLYVVNYNKRQGLTVAGKVRRSLLDALAPTGHSDNPRTNVGLIPTPLLRRAGGKSAEEEVKQYATSSTVRGSPKLPISLSRIEELCGPLRGATGRTPHAVAGALSGMTEHDLTLALDRTRRRRPRPENEAAYLVGTLNRIRREQKAR